MTDDKFTMFDHIKNIWDGKDETALDEHRSTYNPFLISRGVAFSVDCLFQVCVLNHLQLTEDQHFQILMKLIPKRRRYAKWPKKMKYKHYDAVQKYFNYSQEKTMAALRVLSDEDTKAIAKMMDSVEKSKSSKL